MSVVSQVPGFPYYLWTTTDGRCWVRIIDTNEVTEVSREVMRELRKEEKSMRRLQEPTAQRQRQDDSITDTEECMDDSIIIEEEQPDDPETGMDTNWYEIHHALPLFGEWKGLEVNSWSMSPYDTGVKLPIILDSPSGKEIDQENVNLMMDILKRDFSDHQIIIASIYKYDFPELRIIEIKNRLIEPD